MAEGEFRQRGLRGGRLRRRIGIEVKSGRPERPRGIEAFRRRFPSARALVIGRGGVPLEEAFRTEPEALLDLATARTASPH